MTSESQMQLLKPRELRLTILKLKNFKGIKEFSLNIQGEDCQIYGDNATGKTTIFDAFLWLLFGKDSQNKGDFDIKTLNSDGSVQHGIEHQVEGVFDLGGEKVTLRKVYAENWTKKRGSAEKTFTGHTTGYFIDGVPLKKNEYEAKIAEIADEGTFKLLTSPTYFNEYLHWQDRRKILLDVCGDVSDEDVIQSNNKLSKLPEILNGRKLEDHRKIIAARRTDINEELKKIPVRIDEVAQNLPDVGTIDKEKAEQDISTLKAAITQKQQELVRIESGGEIAEKQKQLREIEAELLHIKNRLNVKTSEEINGKLIQQDKAKRALSNLKEETRDQQDEIKSKEARIGRLKSFMDELRREWESRNKEEFSFEQSDTCPACGQKLPEQKLEVAREKALADFNQGKAEELERISREGKEMKKQVDELEVEIEEHAKHIDSVRAEIEAREKEIQDIEPEIAALQESLKAPEDTPEYTKKLVEKESLEAAISKLREGNQEAIASTEQEIDHLRADLDSLRQDMFGFELCEKAKERAEELKAQEKALAAEYERLESELYLTEEFVRAKVNLLEGKINNHFQHARFKLFDVQVNEAVTECCETTYKGVPYSSALNNGARINLGLDIINTLSEHYGFSAPIFLDNREAVTTLIKTKSQFISLIVSEVDKALRVEQKQETRKEAISV